jgi:PKD repeat protein
MRTRVSGFLVAVVAVIVAALMAVPIGSMQGMFGSSEREPVTGSGTQILDVSSRSVDYRWYDMFNVPFGEWYDVRWDVYHNWQPLLDTYPYISKYYGQPPGNDKYYTNMRLDVTGRNMTELNMNGHPEFLPFLGSERGGTATIDWYMQYLTSAEISERWRNISFNDGWVVSLNGTTTMDKQAAMAVLNCTSAGFDNFANWWTAHENEVEQGYYDWLHNEGNKRLDIYNAYEYPFTPLGFDLTAQKVDDKIVLSYDMISWGMEILMTRWLHDAFMPTEWYFEDFRFDATIGPEMTDLHISTAVENAAYAWESVQAPGEPCWVWEGMLQDYVASSLYHPWSDFDPYVTKTYFNKGPGSTWHGQYMPYDYTPGAWNLSEGEELTFTWPSDVVQFERHVGPGVVLNETEYMALGYSEPDKTDMPGNVAVYDSARTVVFTGPLDVWTWSKEQTAHMDLASEWQRLGILPRGMPYLQFVEEPTTPPSTAHTVMKGAQGPRESAVTWEYVPAGYQEWTGHIVNNGLRSLVIDVYDVSTGVPDQIMHQKIRFAAYDAYPTGVVDTASVIMSPTHEYSITVTPSGPKGSSCTVYDPFPIPSPPPVAMFTAIIGYLAVFADGSSSYDFDGWIVSYAWDFGDGSSATGVTATHTYAAEGTYTITLMVTDNAGLTSSASELVTVHRPPLMASFTYTVDGLTVNVNASSSSSAVGIVSYEWDWGDGTIGTGMTATHAYNTTESVATSSEPMSIGRADPSLPPPAIFGFTYAPDGVTALPGCNVTVTNMRTGETIVWNETREIWDPNVNIYLVDMSEFQLIVPPATRPCVVGDILHVEATKGSYCGFTDAPITNMTYIEGCIQIDVTLHFGRPTITLTVTDSFGYTDSVYKTVMLNPPPLPVATFSVAVDHMNVTVDGSGSIDPDGTIVSYDWTFGDGGTASGVTANHTYSLPGLYIVILKATDNDGLVGLAGRSVRIVDRPPIASFTYTRNGLVVNVDASGSSDDYGIVSYVWDWGDGTTGTGVTASHAYAPASSYSIGSGYAISGKGRVGLPHPVFGYTYGSEGATLLFGCNVTVTNLRTGESVVAQTDSEDPTYMIDMSWFALGWVFGDILNVTATKNFYVGWAEGPVTDNPAGYDQIDVTLHLSYVEVTVMLTVTDTIGQTHTVSKTVALPRYYA